MGNAKPRADSTSQRNSDHDRGAAASAVLRYSRGSWRWSPHPQPSALPCGVRRLRKQWERWPKPSATCT